MLCVFLCVVVVRRGGRHWFFGSDRRTGRARARGVAYLLRENARAVYDDDDDAAAALGALVYSLEEEQPPRRAGHLLYSHCVCVCVRVDGVAGLPTTGGAPALTTLLARALAHIHTRLHTHTNTYDAHVRSSAYSAPRCL